MKFISVLQILTLCIGVATLFVKRWPLQLSILGFTLYSVLNEQVGAWYSRTYNEYNIFLYNFYSLVAIIFYLFILSRMIQRPNIRKWIWVAMASYLVSSLVEILFYSGWEKYHPLSFSFGCLLVFVFSCMYFYEMMEEASVGNILKHWLFWLNSAILVFHLLLMIYILSHTLFGSNDIKIIISYVKLLMNLLYNLFLSIAFLCLFQKRIS